MFYLQVFPTVDNVRHNLEGYPGIRITEIVCVYWGRVGKWLECWTCKLMAWVQFLQLQLEHTGFIIIIIIIIIVSLIIIIFLLSLLS